MMSLTGKSKAKRGDKKPTNPRPRGLHTSPLTRRVSTCPFVHAQHNQRPDDGRKPQRRTNRLVPFWQGAVLLPDMGLRPVIVIVLDQASTTVPDSITRQIFCQKIH